jgi:hypothetical protein
VGSHENFAMARYLFLRAPAGEVVQNLVQIGHQLQPTFSANTSTEGSMCAPGKNYLTSFTA